MPRRSQKSDNHVSDMTPFPAQLTVGADPKPIETTVALDGDYLEIASGGESLGRWRVAELQLERIFGGFRMHVEGETAVLKFVEPEKFADALDGSSAKGNSSATTHKAKKSREKTPKQKKEKAKPAQEPSSPAQLPADIPPQRHDEPVTNPPSPASTTGEKRRREVSAVGRLDRALERAQKRFGKRLPDWLFSKGGLVIAVGVLVLLLAKPGWFSAAFLILAAIGLITSAIALLDQVIAVRIFRGGFTPIQGLLVSLVVGLVGILLGAI